MSKRSRRFERRLRERRLEHTDREPVPEVDAVQEMLDSLRDEWLEPRAARSREAGTTCAQRQ